MDKHKRPPLRRSAAPAAANACASAHDLKVTLGSVARTGPTSGGELFVWAPTFATNPHVLLIGMSGAGKTHRIRVLANSILQCAESTVIVVDPHGDTIVDGEERIRFNEQSPFGLNPLAVDPDQEAGGVRVQIENFLDGLEASSRAFGDKQRSLCRNTLEKYYASFGMTRYDPETWHVEVGDPQPTLAGFLEFAREDMRREQLKLNEPAYAALNELKKAMRAFKPIAQGKVKTDIDKARSKAMETYVAHLEDIVEGRADDVILESYNPDVYASVVDRIATLEATGLFKSVPPPFGNARVRVYDISKVRDREQRMFGEVLFEQILRSLKVRGERDSPDTFVLIDEAHRYLDDDPDAPLSRNLKEIRKFGGAMILGSQNLGDFPIDVISNCATKIILGLDALTAKIAAQKLQIEPALLAGIKSRTTALAQMAVIGGDRANWTPIALPFASKQIMDAAGIEPAHEADLRPSKLEAAE